ncbi:hypothetical protein MMC25_003403 [Agyrium rufum]|nr:hypothetical protein [Agyrium rufum]
MKQRFSSLDIKVIAHELSESICSLRLSNVYDLSPRIFLLKFAKPNNKQQVIVDSGFRCHLTSFSRETASEPSQFVFRLRRFLRSRRVTSIAQIGTDRIIEFQFSDGQYRLFLEFYAGGNIILTDAELNVLALLRVVNDEQEQLRPGSKYSLENRQNVSGVPPLSKERVKEALQVAQERAAAQGEAASSSKTQKKKTGDALRRALTASLNEFTPALLDHAFYQGGFSTETTIESVLQDGALFDRLMSVLDEAQKIFSGVTGEGALRKGYILAKPMKSSGSAPKDSKEVPSLSGDAKAPPGYLYEDFFPFKPTHFETSPENKLIEFDGFNHTVDEFFSSIESQKLESRLTEREETAKRKLANARADQQKRLGGLQQIQELNVRKAETIEANSTKVQEVINAVNGLIAQGMDWTEIARLIEMEQGRQNLVAQAIKLPLKLFENTVTILLMEPGFEDEEDFEGDETDSDVSGSDDDLKPAPKKGKPSKTVDKRLAIDLDLGLTPWANARQYYDQKKTAAQKEARTLQSSEMALKSTERKINADLKKALKQEKEVMRPVRQQIWFEKFFYFISSEGYLVVGGRDVQQQEILYRRYLQKGDAYVHSDINGSVPIIIKNKPSTPEAPIPPSTLSQAGTFTIATSSAWESKAVMSAWWVASDQVSKLASNGEYLSVGLFDIKGKKNFLPPAQLLLGFGLMFKISEESKARHTRHRFQDVTAAEPPEPLKEAILSGDDTAAGDVEQEDQEDPETEEDEPTRKPEHVNEENDNNETDAADTVDDVSDNEQDDLQSAGQTHKDRNYQNPLQGLQESDKADGGKEEGFDSPGSAESSEYEGDAGLLSTTKDPEVHSDKGESSLAETAEECKGHRHLSAKERRLQRKGPTKPGTETPTSIDPFPRSTSPHSSISATTKSSIAPPQPQQPQQQQPQQAPRVRGKAGQRAKAKAKYAHQDDEDRALALALLGSNPKTAPKNQAASQEKADKEKFLEEQKQRRREQHQRKLAEGKAVEERRRKKMEGGGGVAATNTGEDVDGEDDSVKGMTEREVAELKNLDAWIGTPLPGDEIHIAIVMCGPWDAFGSRCKWRVKVQPGTGKKGKVVREILGGWTKVVDDGAKARAGGKNRKGKPQDSSSSTAEITARGESAEKPTGTQEQAKATADGVSVSAVEELDDEEKLERREAELIKGLRETEVVGVVPVSKCRTLGGPAKGAGPYGKKGGAGRGGGGAKGGRGGKGSKKVR